MPCRPFLATAHLWMEVHRRLASQVSDLGLLAAGPLHKRDRQAIGVRSGLVASQSGLPPTTRAAHRGRPEDAPWLAILRGSPLGRRRRIFSRCCWRHCGALPLKIQRWGSCLCVCGCVPSDGSSRNWHTQVPICKIVCGCTLGVYICTLPGPRDPQSRVRVLSEIAREGGTQRRHTRLYSCP